MLYIYKAKDIVRGKRIKGEMEALNEEVVRESLIEKNCRPLQVTPKGNLNSDLRELILKRTSLSLEEVCFFCKQMGTMLNSGISMSKSIEVCQQQSISKNLKQQVVKVQEAINCGKSLSEALRETKKFPIFLVSMVACGERSGNLGEVMQLAEAYFEHQGLLKQKVKKALTYPFLVMGMVIIVVIILMVKVVPSFLSMLEETGAEIPLPTKIVLAISNFLTQNSTALIVGLGILSVILIYLKKTAYFKKELDTFCLKLPIFGNLIKKQLAATFSSTLSLLVASGVPMLQALEMTQEVMAHEASNQLMVEAIVTLKQGGTLLNALSRKNLFPPILLSMIQVGEESGSLDDMLDKMSHYFKQEVEVAMDRLIVLIEPTLTIIIAIVIGGIMAAMMLPTFSAATAVM